MVLYAANIRCTPRSGRREPTVANEPFLQVRGRHSAENIRPTLTHGGRTVAALVRRSHRRQPERDFHRTGLGSPTHGGLTFRGHGCSSVVAEPNLEFTSH
jgi:hypothetical protein